MDILSVPDVDDVWDGGELTEPTERPASPIVAVDHLDPAHGRVTLVDWTLGNRCNYACSYCPAALHDGSLGWQAAADVMAFIDTVADHYGDGLGRLVWLQFTGGEPTLHPRFPDIVAHARAKGCRVALISNGSRTPRYWQSLLPSIDRVILTFHREEGDPDHFLRIAQAIAERCPLHVNVPIAPTSFEGDWNLAKRLAAALPGCSVVPKPIRAGFGAMLYPYTDAQKATLFGGLTRGSSGGETPRSALRVTTADGRSEVRKPNDLILQDRNHWSGFRCRAGVESLRVTAEGRILRAVCGIGGVIGRLGETVYLPLTGATCDRPACACVSDILISKAAPRPFGSGPTAVP